MRLFKGISPKNGGATLREGYRVLLEQAEPIRQDAAARAGGQRWSLAELATDDDDLIWLIDWARALDGLEVGQWLLPGPTRLAFGSLLLLFGAEFTRRSLPSDSPWPVPPPPLFSPSSRVYLFTGETPTIHHRLALRSAANRLGLHRVSGTDLPSLLGTISLQYGFSEAEIYSELRDWLTGVAELKPAIRQLLDTPVNAAVGDESRSFPWIWEACRSVLHGWQGETEPGRSFEDQLAASPWILDQWRRPLQALLRRELPAGVSPALPERDVPEDDILELPPASGAVGPASATVDFAADRAAILPDVLDEILDEVLAQLEAEAAPVIEVQAVIAPATPGANGAGNAASRVIDPLPTPPRPSSRAFSAGLRRLPRAAGPADQIDPATAPRLTTATLAPDLLEVVVDQGIDGHGVGGQGIGVRLGLRLARFIDPGIHHEVVVWDGEGRLSSFRPDRCAPGDDGSWWWFCQLPENFAVEPRLALVAVAISLDGRNLASWWPEDDWLTRLPELIERQPVDAAWLLRWFQLPLLTPAALSQLGPLVAHYPLQFVRAWLKVDTGPGLLGMPFKDEQWFGVVREYLFNWQPDQVVARDLLLLLADVDNDHDLREYIFEAAQLLYRVDPVVMVRILSAWTIPNLEMIRIELRRGFAGVVNLNLINARENALIARASQMFNVESSFIVEEILRPAQRCLAGEEIAPDQLDHLRMAARSEDLRRLLAINLLR